MTYEQEMTYSVKMGKRTAKAYDERVFIVESDVFHDHEFKLNFITASARECLYPMSHREYWQIVREIKPDGTVTVVEPIERDPEL